MSDDPNELEPLDPELGVLFGAARGGNKAPVGAKERGWAKLAASVGMPTTGEAGRPVGPGATDGMPTAGISKLLGALVVGVVLGGGAVGMLRPANVVYVDRPAIDRAVDRTAAPSGGVVGMPTVVRGPEPAAEPAAGPVASGVGGAPGASAGPGASAPVIGGPSNLAAERGILDDARTALGRGDGQHALEATGRHQREFPRGQLVEEREAIAIQALTKLRRCDEAIGRGKRFEQRYPNSVLGAVVDAALSVCENLKSPAPP